MIVEGRDNLILLPLAGLCTWLFVNMDLFLMQGWLKLFFSEMVECRKLGNSDISYG